MTALPAKALCDIGPLCSGECRISLTASAITVSDVNGIELGSWPYNAIRQFRGDDINSGKFSFTSGRRGPFGVGDYDFFLTPLYLNELKSTLSKYTGAQFGNEKSPEHTRDGVSPQREPNSSIQPKYIHYGLDQGSIDGQPHYARGAATAGSRSPTVALEGQYLERQRNSSLSALVNQSEPIRPIVKKQLTLKELHDHNHSEIEGTAGIGESTLFKKSNRSRPYVEIDSILSDDTKHPAAGSKLLSESLITAPEPQGTNEGISDTSASAAGNRVKEKHAFISDSSNIVNCSIPCLDSHIYDKLPPQPDAGVYDTPHTSVYSVPRFNESTSPPPTLNTRQGHIPSSPQHGSSTALTRRPLPSTPFEKEQYTSTINNVPNNTNSAYVDIDIEERAIGGVCFQISKTSEPNVLGREERHVVSPSLQPSQIPRFKPTPDVSSDSIAHKLASEGYELVTVAMRSDKTFDESSLNNNVETLCLNEETRTKITGDDDDPDGYIVIRSKYIVAPEHVAYENVVNSSQENMDISEDEQYATIQHLETESSDSGLYETVQAGNNLSVPIILSGTPSTVHKPLERVLVPIATESSSPATTAELRFRARTVGDILDVEKHTYVNIKCEDDGTLVKKGAKNLPIKKPKPTPRNSSSPRLASTNRESAHFDETL